MVSPAPRRTDSPLHQAGHVAIGWLLQRPENLFRSLPGNAARQILTMVDRSEAKLLAVLEVMHILGGLAAENHTEGRLGCWWLSGELEELSIDENQASDIGQAVDAAKALVGDAGKWLAFLQIVAGWTHEAIASPRLRAVVESVAQEIATHGTISDTVAWGVARNAWNRPPWESDDRIPFLALGGKWKARLRPSKPTRAAVHVSAKQLNKRAPVADRLAKELR